jgi:CheY-like chemotaxis protein
MLEKMGYEVLVARDGMEAIELYRAARVDLILMDIQMPIMDGLEATQKIRQIESERGQDSSNKLAIIAVTAHVSDEHRELCLAAGMDGYLPKPVDFSALRELMDGFIESKN